MAGGRSLPAVAHRTILNAVKSVSRKRSLTQKAGLRMMARGGVLAGQVLVSATRVISTSSASNADVFHATPTPK